MEMVFPIGKGKRLVLIRITLDRVYGITIAFGYGGG
jgi:hypothetical protein